MSEKANTDRGGDLLVTVMDSSDLVLIATAKSLLQAEGIDFLAKGEDLQSTMIPMVVGGVQIQVKAEDERRARELLAALV